MIASIHLCKVATFGDSTQSLINLSQFNFVYGTNGCGKTTISRVIANESNYPHCTVTWKNGAKLQALVYNRDFVDRNFFQNTEMPGIFTLGEEQLDLHTQIAAAKSKVDEFNGNIVALTKSLQGEDGRGGKLGELTVLESSFRDKCWAQKHKHDAAFHEAFAGVLKSTDKFKERVLKESLSNKAKSESLADLQKRAETIFGPSQVAIAILADHDCTLLLQHEQSVILQKKVIGSTDVDIAEMIQRLGNSDWVKEGRVFLDKNDKVCPFCQERTSDDFARKLTSYFDDAYMNDMEAITNLENNYKTSATSYQSYLNSIIASRSKYLDAESLAKEKQVVDATIRANIQAIENKKKEPSSVITLTSLRSNVEGISRQIKSANQLITEHNRIVANYATERTELTAQVWKYLLDVELKQELQDYQQKKSAASKAIESIKKQTKEIQDKLDAKKKELRQLEKRMTSVKPTIDAVNQLLTSFGFRSFTLSEGETESTYKLIRADGTTAKETLSEGEKTFVTFLYFYHLLKGSISESGITNDRIVVIDDPVSSLDSDILFIVGSLIKGLFAEVREKKSLIKQIIVLTHNVYFHKEVTFNPKRCNGALNEETFWIIRKQDQASRVQGYGHNPIKTSYELLWDEVRSNNVSNLSLQNTLRRILESYFRILGNINPDELCAKFDGKQRLICKSLFSWVNDGSHSSHDDLFVSIDGNMVQTYLEVFRLVFEKAGHLPHYTMMMGQTQSVTPALTDIPTVVVEENGQLANPIAS
ncbi:MAG: AAA family ATPase [Gemmatales bacterium]